MDVVVDHGLAGEAGDHDEEIDLHCEVVEEVLIPVFGELCQLPEHSHLD
jgi:hypothetical protein